MRMLKISPTALSDIQKGIDYYNIQQKGLGKRFLNAINDTFQKIQNMPQSASVAFDTVRYKVIPSFPYIIIYEFDDRNIHVFRIFNTYQNPDVLAK